MKCTNKIEATQPMFYQKAMNLMQIMKEYDEKQLMSIYKCNEKIAQENFLRFQDPKENGNAIFSFTGLQFKNMQTEGFNEKDLLYAQDHLCIMSGLYGLLRPMDEVFAYRLDLENSISVNLFDYYHQEILEYLKDEIVVDCCSKEYGAWLPKNCLHIEFKVNKNGKLKTEATASKMARGQFVHYCIKNKINSPEQMKAFDSLGYHYEETLSDDHQFVFVKEENK